MHMKYLVKYIQITIKHPIIYQRIRRIKVLVYTGSGPVFG